ncbi:MAG: molecular chaperone HtpG, partial [Myxococcales bacterium]|nr:molecular chaperone HtpG [Myxococcales bacterium]
ADPEQNLLVIEDNGIGMTKDEVIENLGTIARSGTDAFFKKVAELTKSEKKDEALELIGQFGVGFYSVFMVAKRVDLETLSLRKEGEAVLWRSSGEGTFTVLPGERTEPGTKITIHLKDDAIEFSTKWRIEAVIKKYSDFVMFPIELEGTVVNRSAALWRTPKAQVTAEQHAEFFKHITQSRFGDAPLATIHYSVDAPVQFSALVYVPQKAPLDVFMFQKERPGLKLYAKRVLIMENCESLLPVYLRFLQGVVDSEDLSLNVSRETLQDNRTIRTIEAQLVKQVLKELGRLQADDPDAYRSFFEQFGPVLKEGLSIDFKNKDELTDLCLFSTLEHDADWISLKRYVDEKKEDQKAIYYLTGTDRAQLTKSPHLEVFRKKGIDVLLLTDPIDEWVVQAIGSYQDLPLESVAHGKLELDEPEPERDDETKSQLDGAVAAVKKILGDRIADVRLSKRLTETASCLVAREGDPGANLERIMKVLDDRAEQRKRVLELNPDHPIVKNLARQVARDAQSPRVELWSELLYDQAQLSDGVVEDPAALVKRIQQLLVETSTAAVES